VFEIFFRPLAEKKIPAEILVEGTRLSLATLRDKNQRIDWSDFIAVMKNIRPFFTDDELVEIGRMHLRTPMTRFASVVARLLFSPLEFYRWVFKPQDGVGNQLFRSVVPSHRELSETELEVDITLVDGCEMCWDFFIITKGNLTEMPRLLGYGDAEVHLERLERGGRYRVIVPNGASVFTKTWRAITWPLTARSAARELKDAHETLQQRYEQLEDARVRLDRQARRLRAAHAVSEIIHGDLDVDRTLAAIARALVEEAGFESVKVALDAQVDGVVIVRSTVFGQVGGPTSSRPLLGRGTKQFGELQVAIGAGDARAEREELLDFIVPTLSMALDNAISYEVLEEYRRSLEARVIERTTELRQARDKLADTVAHLEKANRLRDRIFANINHEIRTPLSLILLIVEQARAIPPERIVAADRMRGLQTVEDSSRKLLRLVDEMLLLAEGREGEITLRPVACDLGALVQRIAGNWSSAAHAGGFEMDVVVADGCIMHADPAAMERVLSNLLSNAMKYTPRGGRIGVTLTRDGDHARVEVKDTGVGIDEDLKSRLFGRFERGKQAIDDGVSGSGLGLSLVKELIEAHDGSIEVESTEGAGTIVRIRCPLAPEPSAAVQAAAALTIATPPKLSPVDFGIPIAEPDTREIYEAEADPKATILLAEDDPALRDEIARLLAAEYRVIVAKDGANALRLAEMYRPDLLVTDLAMPGMDGVELTRRFLAQTGTRVAPVLVLTALGDIRDRLAGFEAGAVDYVVKPFEPAELRARIRSQLAIRALALKLLETERLASLGRLSAGLAHEMRNPANGIVNAIDPLREALPPACLEPESDTALLLDVIDRCGRQIATLSRHLLGFRRGAELERKPVPLGVLLSRVRATARGLLDGIEVRERLDYTGPVPCAEPLIQQVFANLLDNAAHAAGRGGWIEVSSAQESARVVVEFRDSGSGIPAEHRERIFEPFFTTKPPGSGTGLGLATAREIVVQHGGTLALRDAASGGAVFRVEMPLEVS
jgi:signal transduction histidine kinase